MNAKLSPKTPAIKDWLALTAVKLSDAGIPSANLDAEIILSFTLKKDRTYLHAHPEQIISSLTLKSVNNLLDERLKRVPIAYLTGKKEFYGRQFTVTPDTLIPRPESEDVITILHQLKPSGKLSLIDVGTGSGCLGITAKLEFPSLSVTLADISSEALKVAKSNADRLSADVKMLQSDLLQCYADEPDIIVANLPYVDKDWERSPETGHEPKMALFADNHGLSIIETLIAQAKDKLANNGCIVLEADPAQHQAIIEFAAEQSFKLQKQLNYILAFSR